MQLPAIKLIVVLKIILIAGKIRARSVWIISFIKGTYNAHRNVEDVLRFGDAAEFFEDGGKAFSQSVGGFAAGCSTGNRAQVPVT
jgi:hypothetical protein